MPQTQEPCSVSCLCNSRGLGSNVTEPPSPMQTIRPHSRAASRHSFLPAALPEQSMPTSVPRPSVRSRISSAASFPPIRTCVAPAYLASSKRSGIRSTLITSAPLAAASMTTPSPTGPRPTTRTVSRPETPARNIPWYAVPNPQATRAPSVQVSPSGRWSRVLASASRVGVAPVAPPAVGRPLLRCAPDHEPLCALLTTPAAQDVIDDDPVAGPETAHSRPHGLYLS